MKKSAKKYRRRIPREDSYHQTTVQLILRERPDLEEMLVKKFEEGVSQTDIAKWLKSEGFKVDSSKLSVWYHGRLLPKLRKLDGNLDKFSAKMKKVDEYCAAHGLKVDEFLRHYIEQAILDNVVEANAVAPDKLMREEAKRKKLQLEERRLNLEEAKQAAQKPQNGDGEGKARVIAYLPQDGR